MATASADRKTKDRETAVKLFSEGVISSGAAARMAGMGRVEFLRHLADLGTPNLQGSAKEHREELAAFRPYRAPAQR